MWFVGHESAGYRDVADRFDITISTLHVIITRVTTFIMQLAPEVIKFPTLEEKQATMTYFIQRKGFPGIIGISTYLLYIDLILTRRGRI